MICISWKAPHIVVNWGWGGWKWWCELVMRKLKKMIIGDDPGGVLQDQASADANRVRRMSVSPRMRWLSGMDNYDDENLEILWRCKAGQLWASHSGEESRRTRRRFRRAHSNSGQRGVLRKLRVALLKPFCSICTFWWSWARPLAADGRCAWGSWGGGGPAGWGEGGAKPLQAPVCRVGPDSGKVGGEWCEWLRWWHFWSQVVAGTNYLMTVLVSATNCTTDTHFDNEQCAVVNKDKR